MRIVYMITRMDSIGGAQVHVRDMAVTMSAAGHEVYVLTGSNGPFLHEMQQAGVHSRLITGMGRNLMPWLDLTAFSSTVRCLKALRPDLLSLHSSKAGWLGRAAGRWLRLPTLFTAHGWSFSGGLPAYRLNLYRKLEQVAAPWCERIITVAEQDRTLALKLGVAREEQLVTVHNGVKDVLPVYRAKPERTPPRLIMVARFQEPKDHAGLLHVMAGLKDLDWSLDLVGDGPLLESSKTLARGLGLQGRVEFPGACLDVPERLAAAQIFVLPSHREGFPRSILEGMRAGLPVVASAVGGVAEAVQDGVSGYVVSMGHGDGELRSRLFGLLTDAELRRTMGEAGRSRFEKLFVFETMLEKTLAVYTEVLQSQQRRKYL